MTKEKEILKLMETLKIDRAEAEELWKFDNDLVENEEVEELTKKAKNIRRYEKSDKPRKKTTRERKVDEEKKRLLLDTKTLIEGLGGEVVAIKNEAEFSFNFNGNSYTFKLIKHRPPKK